jgi:hypothetical protein
MSSSGVNTTSGINAGLKRRHAKLVKRRAATPSPLLQPSHVLNRPPIDAPLIDIHSPPPIQRSDLRWQLQYALQQLNNASSKLELASPRVGSQHSDGDGDGDGDGAGYAEPVR